MAYPENFTREQFEPTLFAEVPDPALAGPEDVPVSAVELSNMGQAIADNRESLHMAFGWLNENELNAYNPIGDFPIAAMSIMEVDHASWSEAMGAGSTTGVLWTINPYGLDAITYAYQILKKSNSHDQYIRYALVHPTDTWEWKSEFSYTAGEYAIPSTPNGLYYIAQNSGFSGVNEPASWPTGDDTVQDNEVEWAVQGSFWSAWKKFSLEEDFTPVVQNIDAVSDQVLPNALNIVIKNTTAGPLTLSSVPTIPDGIDGQEIEIINLSAQAITFTDQDTMAGSNIQTTTGPTRALGYRDSIRLKFYAEIGDWIEMGLANVV